MLSSAQQPCVKYMACAGEKWVAKDSQSSSFDSVDLDPELDRPPERLRGQPVGVVAEILKLLPRLMGISQDPVNGSASLAINGGILRSPLLTVNGDSVPGAQPYEPAQLNGRLHPKVTL